MIDIKKLTEKDKGRWVSYKRFDNSYENGRLKSWNDTYIFVVYKCASEWSKYENYTGVTTKPEDLIFIKN